MAATWLRPLHINKGKTIAKTLSLRTDYAMNPDKTEGGQLVTSFGCSPRTVDAEFLLAKREYEYLTGRDQGGRNVLAYHLRQSFKPGEITPQEALDVGYETAMRWLKGKHAFIVAVHTDRAHVHCAIVYNSTTLDCKGKYNNFFRSSFALSEGAVKTLVAKPDDVPILNRLLEHDRFLYLLQMIKMYFEDTVAVGVATRNDMIDFATSTLSDFAKQNPDQKAEILSDARLLKSQKLGDREAEMEKIKSAFLVILKDIKRDIGEGKATGDVATAEFLKQVRERIAANPKELPTADEVTDMVMQMVGKQTALDDKRARRFRWILGKVFRKPR